MIATSQEVTCGSQTDRHPLLMDELQSNGNHEHKIDIASGAKASLSGLSNENPPCDSTVPCEEDGPSSFQVPVNQPSYPSPSASIPAISSMVTRHDEFDHQQQIPLNCHFWFLVELVFTASQIVVSTIVLSMSTHEKPQAPLFAWILGYAVGCAVNLPTLYWRSVCRNRSIERSSTQSHQDSSHDNSMLEHNSYTTPSLTRSSEGEDQQHTSNEDTSNNHHPSTANARLNLVMDHLKMALDCFFAVWFVLGNVWIFGGHASSSEAPNLYRLCIAFLTVSCVAYAMPFILCGIICCCLPCIILIVGREDLNQMRGATAESINALPAYMFKLGKNGGSEGGIVGAGTGRERIVSREDAVCCVCLAKYEEGDELRELPCWHFFHAECVDKWLMINATCPLCKLRVGGSKNDGLQSCPVND